MKNLKILLFLSCLPLFASSQISRQHLDMYFEPFAWELTPESQSALEMFFEENTHQQLSELHIEIFPLYPKDLALQRVETLKSELLGKGIEVKRLIFFEKKEHLYFPYGELPSLETLRITYQAMPTPTPSLTTSSFPDASYLSRQREIIGAQQGHEIELPKGCILQIPANAFADAEGRIYAGEVVLLTREILDKGDALLSNMTTEAENGILESSGMVEVLAQTPEGKELFLTGGKEITVKIPVELAASLEGYQTYQAQWNNGRNTWALADNPEVDVEEITVARKRYRWSPLTKQEIDSLREVREKLIDSLYVSQKRLRAIKKSVNRQNKAKYYKFKPQGKRKATKKPRETMSYRDLTEVGRWAILGKTRYGWKEIAYSPPVTKVVKRYANLRMSTLGGINLDRLLRSRTPKPKQQLIVENANGGKVKLFFKDRFVVLRGKREGDKVIFPKVLTGHPIVIVSSKKNDDSSISLSYSETHSSNIGTISLGGMEDYSKAEYKRRVRELAKRD